MSLAPPPPFPSPLEPLPRTGPPPSPPPPFPPGARGSERFHGRATVRFRARAKKKGEWGAKKTRKNRLIPRGGGGAQLGAEKENEKKEIIRLVF